MFVTVYKFENLQKERQKRDAKSSAKLYFKMYLLLILIKWLLGIKYAEFQ